METFEVRTSAHRQMIDITRKVTEAVERSGIRNGIALVFVPHTTAGVTINENADPDVVHDIEADLERLLPQSQRYYLHAEGNSSSHVRSSIIGCDQAVIVQDGRLVLGTWQGIYFCEFDGPRTRRVHVQVVGD